LGVLCDLAESQDVVPSSPNGVDPSLTSYDASTYCLPLKVMQWAGLDTDNPKTRELISAGGLRKTLAELNDSGRYGFDRIADVIERDL
jgi:hypothetical protein